jgi:hypothetical protein
VRPRAEINDPTLLKAITSLVESSRAFREEALEELGTLRREGKLMQQTINELLIEQKDTRKQLKSMRVQLWLGFTPVAILVVFALLFVVVRALS